MHTVGVTSSSFAKNQKLRADLAHLVRDVRFNDTGQTLRLGELKKFLAPCDAAIVGLDRIDEDLLSALPKLKCIAKYGVGLDNIDFEACQRRSVRVSHTQGVNAYAVAEQTLGMILALMRNLVSNAELLKRGQWHKNGGVELRGRAVGLIGFGFVGQEVARLLQPFGVKLFINDIAELGAVAKLHGAECVDKSVIYHKCDIISLHVPLTNETRHLINAHVLEQFKPNAVLINTSRGGIIDQEALKVALHSRTIGGAGLDVYATEPCTDLELLKLENLLCTPHTGGNSEQAVIAMGQAAIKNLQELLNL